MHLLLTLAELLSRISSKEAQMRDMFGSYMDKSGSNADATQAKLDKMAARVAADYTRAEEWSAQKRELASALWRKVYMHHQRLVDDLKLVNSELVANVASTLPKMPTIPSPSQVPTLLLNAGVGESDAEASEGRLRKKRASMHGAGDSARTFTAGRGSSHSRATPTAADSEGRGAGANDTIVEGEEERDENLYCFCQRASFGEMIGCDSDDCKYEWFHIGCVGVSKPLPQMWVCSDCLAKKKRRRT